MSLLLPTGLTQFVPSNGTLVPISYTDITSSTGSVGPLTLNVSNPSDTVSALFSYSAEINPGPPPAPITYNNVSIVATPGEVYATVDIVVVPGVSATVTNVISSTGYWTYNPDPIFWDAGSVLGADIGGATPTNNLSFVATAAGPNYSVTAFEYRTGVIPGTPPAPTASAPTLGSPTKVFSIPPQSSLLVQIPSSSASLSTGPIDLVASGANLYVTPVLILA